MVSISLIRNELVRKISMWPKQQMVAGTTALHRHALGVQPSREQWFPEIASPTFLQKETQKSWHTQSSHILLSQLCGLRSVYVPANNKFYSTAFPVPCIKQYIIPDMREHKTMYLDITHGLKRCVYGIKFISDPREFVMTEFAIFMLIEAFLVNGRLERYR